MRAVSFDLDGTLVGCPEPRVVSFERVRDDLDRSIPLPSVAEYRTAFHEALEARLPDRAPDGPVRRSAFRRAFDGAGATVDESTIEAFAETYRRRRLERMRPLEGAPELLASLSADHEILVVTNGPADLQREKLRRTELASVVDAIAIAGECGAAKPDPRPFEVAFESVDAAMAGTPHVGDARADLEGALAAGLVPVLLADRPPAWVPDGVAPCDSLDAVGRLLDGDQRAHSASE